MYQDPLEFLPIDKWEDLEKEFKLDYPRGMFGYNVLQTQRKWKQNACDYFKVFCPYGDVKNGMVALNEKDDESYEVVVLCPNDDTRNLKKALLTTKVVDWKKTVILPFAPYFIIECVKEVAQQLNVKQGHTTHLLQYVLYRDTPFEDVKLPEGITFGNVRSEHIPLIDMTWPHRYPACHQYFQLMVDMKCGYGLFFNDTLVSWLFISELGTFVHVYTVEEHRRKGYAELLIKMVINILIQNRTDVFLYIVKGNPAVTFYKKLGFELSGECAWVYFNEGESKVN